jgi:hypothetical protein
LGGMRKNGTPTKYHPSYVQLAEKMSRLGATDAEIAYAIGIPPLTLCVWQATHEDFHMAFRLGRAPSDDRVERSLFQRAVGYEYEATKVFMPAGSDEPVIVKIKEHVPPDVNAAHRWLINRRRNEWRIPQAMDFVSEDGGPPKLVIEVVGGPVQRVLPEVKSEEPEGQED